VSASLSYLYSPLRALDQSVPDRAASEVLQIAHAQPSR
jgi:hypothetical protein